MKKIILLSVLTILFSKLNAQEEYTEFLNNAVDAACKYEVTDYNTNLKYFITALERDNVTPETLPKEFFDKYLEAAFAGFSFEVDLSEEFEKSIYQFAKHGAEQGNPDAMYILGILHSNGKFTEHNESETVKWYKTSAEKGNPHAMRKLGSFYNIGIYGLNKDTKEGKKWLDQAHQTFLKMEKENSTDMILFGLSDYYTVVGDFGEAEKWAKKLADNGNIMGMANLAAIQSINGNNEEAIKWATIAAEKNSPTGILILASTLFGMGEKAKAMEWFNKGCELGQTQNCNMKEAYKNL